MSMIKIAGNPFRSIIPFYDSEGRTHAFSVDEFAAQSEHVTLQHTDGGLVVSHDTDGQYREFTGI